MAAGLDLFLKIDGVEGESKDLKHPGELQLLSCSKDVINSNAVGSAASSPGTSLWKDAFFTMRIDKSATKLYLACVSGERVKKALLTFRKQGKEQQEFLKITFSDVLISSFHLAGSHDADETPVASFSFNFAQIEEEYRAQKADGSSGGAIKYSYAIPKGAKASSP